MAKNKFYAVRVGREVGVFTNWDECSKQVKGFNGAEYKSFSDFSSAMSWVLDGEAETTEAKETVVVEEIPSVSSSNNCAIPPWDTYNYYGWNIFPDVEPPRSESGKLFLVKKDGYDVELCYWDSSNYSFVNDENDFGGARVAFMCTELPEEIEQKLVSGQ